MLQFLAAPALDAADVADVLAAIAPRVHRLVARYGGDPEDAHDGARPHGRGRAGGAARRPVRGPGSVAARAAWPRARQCACGKGCQGGKSDRGEGARV
jgi:hypothetical protein